jgi:hypothetical protein
MTRDMIVNGIELWGRDCCICTLDRGMEHDHNRPIPILPVAIAFAVATGPVGVDSGRWAHGRQLRRLEDTVGLDWSLVDDDPFQVLVDLTDFKIDVVEGALRSGLPLLVRRRSLLQLAHTLFHRVARCHLLEIPLGVEVLESPLPLGVRLLEELLPLGIVLVKLVEDHLGVDTHDSVATLEAGVVVVRRQMLQIGPVWMELPGSSSHARANSKNRTESEYKSNRWNDSTGITDGSRIK